MTINKYYTTKKGSTMSPSQVIKEAINAKVTEIGLDEMIIRMIDPEVVGQIGVDGFSCEAYNID